MKKMFSVFVLGFAGLAIAQANPFEAAIKHANPATEQYAVQPDSVKRTLIEATDLPEALQTTLRGDDYQGWTIATAYLVEQEGQDAYYEVSLQREGEEELRIVLLNADGTVRE